jgi:protein-tyrosine phosphatase
MGAPVGAPLGAAFGWRARQARVLIHCHWGRRRSAMVAYAVLRMRGSTGDEAAALVLRYRPQAELVPNYVRSAERWLASAGAPLPAYNAKVNA